MLLLGHRHVEVLLRHWLLLSLLILHILLLRVVIIRSPAVLLLRLIGTALGHLVVVGRLEADAARGALHHIGTLARWHWHHAWRPTLVLVGNEAWSEALALWHGLTRGLERR